MKPQNTQGYSWEIAEQNLSLQMRRLKERLQSIEKDESSHFAIPQPTELGSRSWEADIRSTRSTIREEMHNMLTRTKGALSKIKEGIYGKCESCGRQIEVNRLKIMPIAEVCLACIRE